MILTFALCLATQHVLPVVDKIRLIDGDRELAPLPAADPPAQVATCGAGALAVRTDQIELSRDGAVVWKLEGATNGLHFAGADARCAYFLHEKDTALVKRIELATGKWAAPWSVEEGKVGGPPEPFVRVRVGSLLASDSGLFVLRLDERGPDDSRRELLKYHVARLDPETGTAEWSRSFEASPADAEPGAVLMAPMRTLPWAASTRALVRLGEDLVVCVGGKEPVIRLSATLGKTVWQVDRPWEFQRAYIGPSMWQHYVWRFGVFDTGDYSREAVEANEHMKARLEASQAAARAFNEQWAGSIAGGPFVVDAPGRRGESEHLLLVTVLAPKREWSAQLANMFVCELDGYGKPQSVVALPRPMIPGDPVAFADRVVIPCSNASYACIAASELGHDFPGSAPDRIGSILWFKELRTNLPAAWMTSDPARDFGVSNLSTTVRVAAGGRIEKRDSKVISFPLHVLDPATGNARLLELRVPFEGEVRQPQTNYQGGEHGFHAWGWHALALTSLELDGKRIVASLGNGRGDWSVAFQLP